MSSIRVFFVGVLVAAMSLSSSWVATAFASVSNSSADNLQDGDNRDTTGQRGTSGSGDAVGGQVAGVVAAGRTSVDARNVSKDSSVESGDAHATNSSKSFVGLG